MSIRIDMSRLEDFEKSLGEFKDTLGNVMEEAIKEIALRELRSVKKLTPVGDTGTLRRSWYVGDIKRKGLEEEVTIYNNTNYGNYVEFGHRTRDHKKWVPGKFMLTISEKQIEKEIEKIVDRHLEEAFKGL